MKLCSCFWAIGISCLIAGVAYGQRPTNAIAGTTISEHSFDFNDTILGKVRFIPTQDISDGPPKVHFYIKNRNGALSKLDDPSYGWAFFKLEAVSFVDIDGNGMIDIVMIAKFASGIGPTGAVPFDVPIIYLRSKESFRNAKDVSIAISERAKGELNLQKVITFFGTVSREKKN